MTRPTARNGRDQRSRRLPKLCHHKASGRAVVRLDGRDHYCGPWGSQEAREEYDRLIEVYLARGRRMPADALSGGLTITRLVLAYDDHAQEHYRTPDGRDSSEQGCIKQANRRVRRLYGRELARDFGPLKLKAVRQAMIDEGLARKTVNDHTSRIKRMFRWAASNEMIPASVWHGLQAVQGLRRGRSRARETEPVTPVPEEHIRKTVAKLSPEVAGLVRLLEVTGMRPGEAVAMRMRELDRSGKTWEYRPAAHKTAHHGHERVVYLGPRAQAILRSFLKADPEAWLFSPAEAERRRHGQQREERRTPMTPSQCARKPKAEPKRTPGQHYTTASLRRAVARACDAAKVPRWNPHRLRHNAATLLRKEHGIDAARVVLGHRSAAVTEIYAELDRTQARDVMARVG